MSEPNVKPSVAMIERSSLAGYRLEAIRPKLQKNLETLLGCEIGTVFHKFDQGPRIFVTTDLNDTIEFPKEHEWSGRPRYAWADSSVAGIKVGTLIPFKQNQDGINYELSE